MHIRYILLVVVLLVLAFGVGRLSAAGGTLDSPGPPDDPASASYTLEDIYNRLDTGAAGSQSTFSEPTSGPTVGTGHTLDEVMTIAPEIDDTYGATQTRVLTGAIIWGLTSGQWGQITGTMPNNGAVTMVPTTISQTIAEGYHNGSGYVEGDADLMAGNIRSGVSIFGVAGDPNVADTSTGDATAADIVAGKVAWADGFELTGTAARFTDNGNGTVTDNHNGLTWLKNANCWGAMTLAAANSAAANLAGGQCGIPSGGPFWWRLPSIWELYTLVDPRGNDPALPLGHPFTGVQYAAGQYYWSTTLWPNMTQTYWTVTMDYVNYIPYDNVAGAFETTSRYVWPVYD